MFTYRIFNVGFACYQIFIRATSSISDPIEVLSEQAKFYMITNFLSASEGGASFVINNVSNYPKRRKST